MADENDPNLVSNVEIVGADKAVSDLNKIGDAGEKAFGKLGTAAKKAGTDTKASTDKITQGLDQIDNALPSPASAQTFTDLQNATKQFGIAVQKNIKDVVEFGARIAALGTAAAASVGGILFLARSVSKQFAGAADAIDDTTKSQIAQLQVQQSAATSAVQYESQLRQLNQQLSSGKISFDQYREALKSTRAAYQENMRVQGQLQDIQEQTRIETEKLQKQAADRKAYQQLIDTYGGPLTQSLVSLGNVVEQTRQRFINAFGPGLASAVDVLESVINKNSSAINKFANDTSTTIANFVSQNRTAIVSAVEGMGEIISAIVQGVVAVGPTVLQIINGVVIPAFRSFMSTINEVAATINRTFGTNINGVFLLGVIALLKFTKGAQLLLGTFKTIATGVLFFQQLDTALVAVSRGSVTFLSAVRLMTTALGPWGIAIGLLVIALTALATQIDWKALGAAAANAAQVVTGAWNQVVAFFSTLPVTIPLFFQNLWLIIVTAVGIAVQNVINLWNTVLAFFASLPGRIVAFFTSLWATVVAGVTATTQLIVDAWNAVVDFFASLPDKVVEIFMAMGALIVNVFNDAINNVKKLFADILNTAKQYIQPVIDLFKELADLMSLTGNGAGGSAQTPAFASGGHVGTGPVRGPGTSTSDSILALLSNNEYVVRARAVAKYGRSFLDAVNSGRLSLSNLAGYAAGGLVTQMPALALPGGTSSDGPARALRPMNISIGGEMFEGLLAPETVANKMSRFAVTKQSRSAGRKPAWFGGN